MRRKRVVRNESPLPAIAGVALGALAGFALGALLMQRHGGLRAVFARAGRELARSLDRDGAPPMSVYEMDSIAHDDGDYGASEDVIERNAADDAHAAEIEERVLDAFLNDPVMSHCSVEISASGDGVIEIDGWVEDPEHVQHAAIIAEGVPGVAGVANNLRVRRARRTRTS